MRRLYSWKRKILNGRNSAVRVVIHRRRSRKLRLSHGYSGLLLSSLQAANLGVSDEKISQRVEGATFRVRAF